MKKSLAVAGITLALILTGCNASESPKQADRIEEDEAGWDCRTMGNGICGEDLPTGAYLLPSSECPIYQPVCYGHPTPWTEVER